MTIRTTDDDHPDVLPRPPSGPPEPRAPAPAPEPDWQPVPGSPGIEIDRHGRRRTNLPLPKA